MSLLSSVFCKISISLISVASLLVLENRWLLLFQSITLCSIYSSRASSLDHKSCILRTYEINTFIIMRMENCNMWKHVSSKQRNDSQQFIFSTITRTFLVKLSTKHDHNCNTVPLSPHADCEIQATNYSTLFWQSSTNYWVQFFRQNVLIKRWNSGRKFKIKYWNKAPSSLCNGKTSHGVPGCWLVIFGGGGGSNGGGYSHLTH